MSIKLIIAEDHFAKSIYYSQASLSWYDGILGFITSSWRHQMKTFSALLAICAGNSPVPGEFPAQRPVTRSFDVFFDLRLNKRLSKQSWGWWFETPSCPLWRHSNDTDLFGDMLSSYSCGNGCWWTCSTWIWCLCVRCHSGVLPSCYGMSYLVNVISGSTWRAGKEGVVCKQRVLRPQRLFSLELTQLNFDWLVRHI